MKLTCDICGSSLQMNADNQGATCAACGMNYSLESLRAKVGASGTAPAEDYAPASRELVITRKFGIAAAPYIISIMVDGEEAAYIGTPGTISIPVSEGEHEVYAVITHGADKASSLSTEKVRIYVAANNWSGTVGLRRGAFRAFWELKLTEM